MPFEIPADLHPDLTPIAFLLGHWQGNGHGDYPTIDAFEFAQELAFTHDGRPFLYYLSRSWELDADGQPGRPRAIETGFLRPQPDGELELLLAHATGFVEIYYGRVDGAKIELSTDAVVRTKSAKEYTGGQRLYGLVEGDLLWAFDMAAVDQPLQPHIWARLKRVSSVAKPHTA
jgi:THAP4-like, heme-binding beta-barrel domain